MSLVWDILYAFALTVCFPVLFHRMVFRGKYRRGIREKIGGVPRRRSKRECLWLHGVSMGEILASRTLVDGFRKRHPDWDVVISATTDTGYEAACKAYPELLVIRYPLDLSPIVMRSLSRIRPSLIVLMELELWPNFIRVAHRRGIPVVIANGRLSEEGFRIQRFWRVLIADCYRRIAGLAVQTEQYARRFEMVGAPRSRITVTGSVKYDALANVVPPDGDGLRRELGIGPEEKIIVAGSTTPGEEEILLDVYERLKAEVDEPRLVVVPRHPERFNEVARLIEQRGHKLERRSAGPVQKSPSSTVILGDTMGELVRFYSLASVVFVGKSLIAPGGGQNIMEPAALGKPVVFGPYTGNFTETRDDLLAVDAAREVANPRELHDVIRELLSDEHLAANMGGRARAVIEASRGATDRTLDILEKALAKSVKVC